MRRCQNTTHLEEPTLANTPSGRGCLHTVSQFCWFHSVAVSLEAESKESWVQFPEDPHAWRLLGAYFSLRICISSSLSMLS